MNSRNRALGSTGPRERKRGGVLVVALGFAFMVAGMGVVMIQLQTGQTRRQLAAIDTKRALYIAEAGLSEAFLSVAVGKTGNIGTAELPAIYGDGVFWVEALEGTEGEVALTSTGLCGSGRFALSAVLMRNVDPVTSLGIYGGVDVTVGTGVVIDGYDSTAGAFDAQVNPALPGGTTGKGGRLISSGDVALEAAGGVAPLDPKEPVPTATTIYGDVHPGQNGVVTIGAGATITGSTTPLKDTANLPDVIVPDISTSGDMASWRGETTLSRGQHRYDKVTIAAANTLTINGPATVVFSDLVIESGAVLNLNPLNGQIAITITDHLQAKEGSSILNPTQDPLGTILMVAASEWADFDGDRIPDPPVEFRPDGSFHGFIYAPGADFTIYSGLHFLGGVVAQRVTLETGARLSFDHALVSADVSLLGLPMLTAWRIVELPKTNLVARRADAISLLDQAGITPVKSADASAETYLAIKYYDAGGSYKTYSGLASLLNWSDVDTVVAVIWDDDAVIGDEGQKEYSPSVLTKSRTADGILSVNLGI